MRIVIHDYAGHPFQLQLSRELAHRGHEVVHQYNGTYLGPKADLRRREDDSETLHVEAILNSKPFKKNSMSSRLASNIEHGKLTVSRLEEWKPDVVVTANTPLEAVDQIQGYCREVGIPHIFWVQDLIAVAFDKIIARKIPVVGGALGRWYNGYEHKLLQRAAQVIVISDDFKPFVPVDPRRVTTIENWAPLADLPMRPVSTEWSVAHGLDTSTNIVYSGTLGMKHNPALLLRLAKDFRNHQEVKIVVVSEGESIGWLKGKVEEEGLGNMVFLPFQSAANLPDVTGCAAVLVAILEPEAGVFSVPSKVLSYLCAGRSLLLGVPPENLAARIVTREGAGIAVSPSSEDDFAMAASKLFENPVERDAMGQRGRAYAEKAFNLERITDAFEAVVCRSLKR